MLEAKAFLRGTSTGTAGGFPTQGEAGAVSTAPACVFAPGLLSLLLDLPSGWVSCWTVCGETVPGLWPGS